MLRLATLSLLALLGLPAACTGPDSSGVGSPPPTSVTGVVDTLATTASDLLAAPTDLHRLPDGRLLVSDGLAHRIQVFAPGGSHLATLGQSGEGPGEFNRPGSLGSRGDTLLVVDALNGRIQLLSGAGESLASLPLHAGPPPVLTPHGRVAHPTFGVDSVMAVVRELDGEEVVRLGIPPAPVSRMIRLSELKAEIEAGGVPDLFRNTAFPVGDAAGAIWLYTPALARVERYGPEGEVEARLEFPDVRGAGDFLADPGAGEVFFTIPERAELIRVRSDALAGIP